jgi:uncharacterized membrane protein
MNKKIYSLLIIVVTLAYVLYSSYIISPEIKDIGMNKTKQVLARVNNVKFYISEQISRNIKIQYDEVKQNSAVESAEKEILANSRYNLSYDDMERLFTAVSKLSPIDQLKASLYLEGSREGDARTAVNLLKERLSDREFERIKDIYARVN